jgi:hypothetical protein
MPIEEAKYNTVSSSSSRSTGEQVNSSSGSSVQVAAAAAAVQQQRAKVSAMRTWQLGLWQLPRQQQRYAGVAGVPKQATQQQVLCYQLECY